MKKEKESCYSHFYEDVIGYDYAKEELYKLTDILCHPETYEPLNIKIPKGLLMYGEPGVGKTLIATCLMHSCDRHAFVLRKQECSEDFITTIRTTFDEARMFQPSILLLDDLNKYSNSDESLVDTDEFVAIQTLIDEVAHDDIFIIATANDICCFPDSLLRCGRFDKIIELKNPSTKDASKILAHYLGLCKSASDIDTDEIARIMSGCSCARLRTLINDAGILAGFESCDKIEKRHVINTCLAMHYNSPQGHSLLDSENALHVAYHEAGHVVAQECFYPGTSALVSLRVGLESEHGITIFHDDKPSYSCEYYEHLIMRTLAGKAALDVKFGANDPGATSDLSLAFHMASKMIRDWGYMGLDKVSRHYNDSCFLREKQEEAEDELMADSYLKVKKYLSEHMDWLDAIANSLLEKETLLTNDIAKLTGAG